MATRRSTSERAVGTTHRMHLDEVLKRLHRIEGQVSGIRRMYEGERYCIDVLDQISAARAGLEAAALLILEDHINGCVQEAMESGEGPEKTAELVDAIRRYVRRA